MKKKNFPAPPSPERFATQKDKLKQMYIISIEVFFRSFRKNPHNTRGTGRKMRITESRIGTPYF